MQQFRSENADDLKSHPNDYMSQLGYVLSSEFLGQRWTPGELRSIYPLMIDALPLKWQDASLDLLKQNDEFLSLEAAAGKSNQIAVEKIRETEKEFR